MVDQSWKDSEHPWDRIFKREGRVFVDPYPRFTELIEVYKKHDSRSILDLGCGSGRHVVGLAAEGFRVVGCDISTAGLRLAFQWLDKEGLVARLVQADMRANLPFRDGVFDGLLSTQVIHHALRIEVLSTIEEIKRVIAPGGIGFVTVAAKIHEDQVYHRIEPGTYVPQSGSEAGLPHHIFSKEEFIEAFSDTRIIEISLRAEGKVRALLFQNTPV